jgi:hypothetical protein
MKLRCRWLGHRRAWARTNLSRAEGAETDKRLYCRRCGESFVTAHEIVLNYMDSMMVTFFDRPRASIINIE